MMVAAVMSMTMMLAMTTITTATIEAAAATVTATTVVTTATSAAIASTAERPLEARARIAAYTGGLAREFALRFVAGVRSASFAREKE